MHWCRPQYLALSSLCHEFPGVPIIAVTATATAAVIKEITQILPLKQPKILLGAFNRPNIHDYVRHKELIGDGSDEAVLQVLSFDLGTLMLALPFVTSHSFLVNWHALPCLHSCISFAFCHYLSAVRRL